MDNNFWLQYYNNVLKKWWNLFFPAILTLILASNLSIRLRTILTIGYFIIYLMGLNFYALYLCYKRSNNKPFGYSLPDSYQNLISEISEKMPNLLERAKNDLIKAFTQREKNNIDLIIEEHYLFYNTIKNELIKLYKNADDRIVITPSNSRIKKEFFDNYSEIERWYNQLHSENWNPPTFPETTQLIDKTNHNLYILLREVFIQRL